MHFVDIMFSLMIRSSVPYTLQPFPLCYRHIVFIFLEISDPLL
jgi:hypothetical protein